MTTALLKEPFRLHGQLFLGDRLLASVRCWLSPANAPVSGMAPVPDEHNWLSLGTLTLLLHNGDQYRILPTKLDPVHGALRLLKFDVLN